MNYNTMKSDLKAMTKVNMPTSYLQLCSLIIRLVAGSVAAFSFLLTFFEYQTLSIAWIAPFYEEVFRFTIFGAPLLVFELLSKYMMIIVHVFAGDYGRALCYLPSMVGHVVFFLADVPLEKRVLIHFLWNYYVMSQNTGAINYELYQGSVTSVIRAWGVKINLFVSPLLRRALYKVKKARRRRAYRRNRVRRRRGYVTDEFASDMPEFRRETPNMDFYVKCMFETQSYAKVVATPAVKCKLIPLKLHEELLFKTRKEMRDAKKAKAKNDRYIRKKLTKQAREIAMKNRIEAAAVKKIENVLPREVVAAEQELIDELKKSIESKAPHEEIMGKASHLIGFKQEVNARMFPDLPPPLIPDPEDDSLKGAPPPEDPPERVLNDKQKVLVDKLLSCILAGKSQAKIKKTITKLVSTLGEDDAELAESLKELVGVKLDKQVLGGLSRFMPAVPSSVPVTHSLHDKDRASLDALMTKFSGLADTISASPIVSKGKLSIEFDIRSFLVCTGIVLGATVIAYLLYKYPASVAGQALKAVLMALAGYYVTPVLKSCVSDALKAFDDCKVATEEPVEPENLEKVPLASQALGTTLYSIAGPLITWAHYTQTGELKDKSIIKQFIDSSAMAEKAQKAVVFTSTTFLTFMSELFSWLGDSLGWTGLSKVFDLYPELSEIESKVQALEAKLHSGTIFPDKRTALEVAGYRTSVVKIVSKLKPGSAAAIRAGFLVKAIDVLYRTTAIGHAQNSVRAEPVCMNLYSPPGVGKSTLVQSFAHELLAQPGVLDKETRNAFKAQRDNYVYCIDATQNYPDGYYSQLVTILDDWAIRKDKAGAEMDTGLTALIRWVNGMPYNVESAHLELKGKIFAANIFMLATTNCRKVDAEQFPGFTDVGAVIRRLHMSYMLSIADDFCIKKVDYEHRKIRPDVVKYITVKNAKGVEELLQVLPYEAWLFVPWNLAKGEQAYDEEGKLRPPMTYDEVMEEAVERIKKSRRFNAVHKATIDDRVARALAKADRLDAEEEAARAKLEKQTFGKGFDPTRFDSDLQKVWTNHPWLRDAYEKHVRSRYPGKGAEEILADDDHYVKYTSDLSKPGFNMALAQDLLRHHPVDWNMFRVAHQDECRTALDCVSYTVTTVVGRSLEKLADIWKSVKSWVSDNQSYALLGLGAAVAGAGLWGLYNWLSTSFFPPSEPESLQPKHNKAPVKGRAALRSQMPRPARKVNLDTEAGCAVNLVDIANLVNNNRFEISLSDNPAFRQCSALGIYNRYLVMPRHMITEFIAASGPEPLESDLKMTFKRARADTGFTFSMTYRDMVQNHMMIDFPENHGKGKNDRYNDRIILKIPDFMMQNIPDIRKHLVSVHDRMWQQREIAGTVNLVSTTSTGRIIEQFWDAAFKVDHKEDHQDDLSIINGLFYSQETARGDCGSPLFAASKGSAKFIGFHIAGNSSYRIAVGIALRSEDFDFLDEEPDCPMREIPLESESLEGRLEAVPQAGTGRVVAKLLKSIYQPTHTTLERAPFFDVLDPCGLYPSVTRPKVVDGVEVKPLHLGLKNYNRDRVMFDTEHFSEIAHDIKRVALENGCRGKRILTVEEAIHGNEEMDGIPKKTSLGIPMIDWATPEYPGKTIVMGRGEEKRGPKWDDMMTMYEETRAAVLRGENPTLLLKAMIKDELLPKEKVDKANSRITFTAPFLLQVFTRMQYGDMTNNIMKKENAVRNRQALGLNVYAEWDVLAQYLLKYGDRRLMDFDYRKYDGSLGRQILNLVFDIMDALSPCDTEEDRKIKAWLRAQTLNAYVAHGDVVVEFDGSNTSGNSLTTVINNFANQILTMFVLSTYILKKEGLKFESGLVDWRVLSANVRMCTLGDDVIMALGHLFDGITTKDFAEILRPYNIDITNGDKTDPVLNPKGLRTLAEVTFLKRSFRLENGRYVAPLALQSISKMIQWKHKNVTEDEYKDIVKNALLELAIHGEEVYNEAKEKMKSRMLDMGFLPHGPNWAADFKLALKLEHSWQG